MRISLYGVESTVSVGEGEVGDDDEAGINPNSNFVSARMRPRESA